MAARRDIDVPSWLAGLGLAEYADQFAANDIDADVLTELTADDLKEIGVTSVGHRRKLLSAIEKLAAVPDNARQAAAAQPSDPVETVAERRILTVMFCDLADSTALSVGMDPEDFRDHIREFRTTVEAALQPFDAHVAQYAGDGILAYFGYPTSTDHDAEKAVEASLSVVQKVRGISPFGARRARVRIGLATGLTVVGGVDRAQEFRGDSAVGETLNLAARLQSLAPPDGIVIARSTRKLVGDLFTCDDLGLHDLKGFSEPVAAYRVTGRKSAASRFDALRVESSLQTFVGRNSEVAILRDALAALQRGESRFFRVVGEAGIGKSRLLREALFDDEANRERTTILQCSPYQTNSPFFPVRYLVERLADLSAAEDPDVARRKLAETLDRIEPCKPERLAIFCDLLGLATGGDELKGMNQYQKRQLTIAHVGSMLLAMLRARPILVLEDVQWLDPSTAEVLDAVLSGLGDRPVLIAALSRPGPSPKWFERTATTTLQLDRLSAAETEALVRSILGQSDLLGQAVRTLVERCDGVPIFAEELTRGFVAGVQQGPGDELDASIPATLAESVMARIDRLNDGRKIASTAAAIGREFPTALLVAVSGLPERTVRAGVVELLSAGIIEPGYSSFGEAIRFRQMLIRDAAYQLLLRKDRQTLHRRIVEVLRQGFPAIAEALPHVMAMQLAHAGDGEGSIEEWQRAASAAMRNSAYREAVRHLGTALETLATLPPSSKRDTTEISLRTSLIGALIPTEGYQSDVVKAEMERTVVVARASGDAQGIVIALYSKWVVLGSSGDIESAYVLAREMSDIAQKGSEVDRLIAWRACGTSLLFLARLDEAIVFYERFVGLYDEGRHGEALRTMHGDLALMVLLGLAEAHALADNREAAAHWRAVLLDKAAASRRAHEVVHVDVYAGCLHPMLVGDERQAAIGAEKLMNQVETHDLAYWRGHARLFDGLAKIAAGEVEEGFRQARSGIDLLLSANAFNNCWYILMAGSSIDHGFLEEAETMLDIASRLIELGDRRFAPEYHRMAARLARRKGCDAEDVEAQLAMGLTLARSHGSRLFERLLLAEYGH